MVCCDTSNKFVVKRTFKTSGSLQTFYYRFYSKKFVVITTNFVVTVITNL